MSQQTYQILAKLACRPQIPFYRGFFENGKDLELVSRSHFSIEIFDKFFFFVILHKLAKFHYQTMYTSQVIQ